jgi:hypothetical protein
MHTTQATAGSFVDPAADPNQAMAETQIPTTASIEDEANNRNGAR